MSTADTRMRNPDRQGNTRTLDNPGASGISAVFGFISERDRELQERERIRLELVKEQFDIYPASRSAAKPTLTAKIASLFRLS